MRCPKQFFVFLCLIFISNIFLGQEKNIKITTKRNQDKSVDFYYKKRDPGSFFLSVKFSNLSNSHHENVYMAVKESSGFLFQLRPIDKKKSIRYSYRYSWIRGNPKTKVDSLFTYVLPIESGNKLAVRESKNVGADFFGSEKPLNWKSYQGATKTTNVIRSMRKGVVVKIVDKYDADSIKKVYTSSKNRISIEHEDGSLAVYKGFKRNSFQVKLGQVVYPHTPLGLMHTSEKGYHYLSFQIYHLFEGKYDYDKKETLKTRKSKHKFITPYFLIDNLPQKLVHNKKYDVDFNELVFIKEFSKKEKRKYKKKPEDFK